MTSPAIQTGLAAGLRLVGASAGSGKTYRLTEEVTRAVDPSSPTPIGVTSLIGVTYTKKAQAELEARIRRVLLHGGAAERAQQLPLSYLGTVHALGLRLLKEFALDAGLSPQVDVIPGNEGRRLLQATLERELEPELRSRLQRLAVDLQLNWDGRTSRSDWVTPIDDIMTLARGNRIAPEHLPGMARRSVEGLTALLPPPVPDGALLEAELARAVASAIQALVARDNRPKVADEALGTLRASATQLEKGRLLWNGWANLAKLDAGKRALELVAPVHEAASAYDRHPRFATQLAELTLAIFEAARVGLVAYASWKAERGLLDYVDMIDRALDILELPAVTTELQQRLRLLVVDEFQDTSPIQLALFMRLHAVCGRSVWVGDRKQCIFEYAGADPALMEAVTSWAEQCGGQREHLPHNYRSRPELVGFNTTLFSAAFAAQGYTLDEIATTAKRPRLPVLETLPPLGLWWLEGKEHLALADGVARLLQSPAATPVVDRATTHVRPVRPADIAILVYSNAEAERVSLALKAHGIQSVLPRVGLLTTPEGTLVSAALRVLVDARDSLATAELDALTGFGGGTPDEWLGARVRARSHGVDAAKDSPWAPALETLRGELPVLSPAEALDRVLTVLDLPALAIRWPDPEQRLSNLEALRALAAAYEQRCAYQREAASLGGLLRYFEETQQEIRQRDEERATDEQHVGSSASAVVISTFHKAKGLEWPVVIVGSLGRSRKRDAFEVTPESDQEAFDAAAPLAGRWIRYWPWPLGQVTKAPLAERAENSAVGRVIAERDGRERVRLLYVAFTRARDHLILGVHLLKKGPSKAWLDELQDSQGPLLTLPEPDSASPVIAVRGPAGRHALSPRAWRLEGTEPTEIAPLATTPRYWFTRSVSSPAHAVVPPYYITPSSASLEAAETESLTLPKARVIATTRFTKRMSFSNANGTSWDAIGNALHAFLAADYPELAPVTRNQLADSILSRAELSNTFTSDALLAASDALRAFVDSRWPASIWHREIPVSAAIDTPHGGRRIEGTIDLLLQTPDGYVIIDHKSFPGRQEHWPTRALGYAPQLSTYEMAIQLAGGSVIGKFVHFTVGGGIVEIGDE